MRSRHHARMVIVLLVISSLGLAHAQDLRQILDLSGTWRFELGDNARWSDPSYNDSKWDNIKVPSPWEEEGYPGYDGYAWYRKHFRLEHSLGIEPVYLCIGHIDDVAEVFLNGTLIGFSGRFPPRVYSEARLPQQYLIPKELLRYGSDNVIAARVYDHYQAGGIVRGEVGLYEPDDYLKPDYDLSGNWKFNTGDEKSWAEESFDDSRWQNLHVPGLWEVQGYRDYDGFAWYRVKFSVPGHLRGRELVLLLGKIDDVDETYLNGKIIGRTGPIYSGIRKEELFTEWLQPRAYVIPPSLLRPNDENTLAVRVCDVWLHGGIYDGPIGLVEKDRYTSWKKKPRSIWDLLRLLFE